MNYTYEFLKAHNNKLVIIKKYGGAFYLCRIFCKNNIIFMRNFVILSVYHGWWTTPKHERTRKISIEKIQNVFLIPEDFDFDKNLKTDIIHNNATELNKFKI